MNELKTLVDQDVPEFLCSDVCFICNKTHFSAAVLSECVDH